MINIVWKRMDCAHWCLLLRWVSRSSIVFSKVRDHHLSIALCTQRPRLK
uniref:Uncharacterized protein n=1 Tax=Arundo donax TaxID=35708 RepID=A0A0A9FI37_ARUDO